MTKQNPPRDPGKAPPCPTCNGQGGWSRKEKFRVQDRNGEWRTGEGTVDIECGACRGSGQGG